MITEQELADNGFKYSHQWNGRYYYAKNGFKIVSHYGIYRFDSDNPSGYGEEIETIDSLNKIYKEFVKEEISRLERVIKKDTNTLNILRKDIK